MQRKSLLLIIFIINYNKSFKQVNGAMRKYGVFFLPLFRVYYFIAGFVLCGPFSVASVFGAIFHVPRASL